MSKKKGETPELRQDFASGDWVLFAPRRSKRPGHLVRRGELNKQSKSGCLFESPKKISGGILISSYPDAEKWRVQVIPNKFAAVWVKKERARQKNREAFRFIEGYGHHELIITKNHHDNFPKLSVSDANLLFYAFQDRYRSIAQDKNTAHISIFHNWGPKAGASIYHPHYQVISTPVVPPMAERNLLNARRYYRKHRKCIQCEQIKFALKDKRRVICEDELAVALAPYAPREPFEFEVLPKHHSPFFEDAGEHEILSVIKNLQVALTKLEGKIKNANYNFYFSTAPVKSKNQHTHYHWHIQVVPRLNISAGFELTTGIEINTILPETAVDILNNR